MKRSFKLHFNIKRERERGEWVKLKLEDIFLATTTTNNAFSMFSSTSQQ
jgi:hypothetical protein